MSVVKQHNTVTGMQLMVAATLLLPGIDVFAKILTRSMPVGEIVLARFFLQSLFLLPLVLLRRKTRAPSRRYRIHLLRGVLIAGASLFFFSALKYLPLADALSIFFIEPIVLAVLSILLLGEKLSRRLVVSIGVGFIGTLIIIRPGLGIFGLPGLLPLAAATLFACYIAATRSLSASEDPAMMQLTAGLSATVVMALALLAGSHFGVETLYWIRPNLQQFQLMLGMGLMASLTHLTLVHAFRRTAASVLAPLQYLEMVSATLLGYWIFNEFPDLFTLGGAVLIIVSGLYMFRINHRGD